MGKGLAACMRRRVTVVTEQKIDHRHTSVITMTRQRRPPPQLKYVTGIHPVNSVFRGLKSNLRHGGAIATQQTYVAEKLLDTSSLSILNVRMCVTDCIR